MSLLQQIAEQLPPGTIGNLDRADSLWRSIQQGDQSVPHVVESCSGCLGELDWDVVICGATLGIFMGAALAQQGWRVAVLERGLLKGRAQEWNISRQELVIFLQLGLLTEAELETAIVTEYNPGRISFLGGPELWVRDVLNIGVDPVYLLERLKQRFLQAGGQLFEQVAFTEASIYADGLLVQTADDRSFKTRLMLDAMGHFSPIARQARKGQKPDGICLVVGTCAQGFPKNETGDLFVSFTPIQNQCQYFWEAFPAKDGRTTYLFTYLDAHPDRPSLTALFEDYLHFLPEYQQVELEQLQFQRALFGLLPSYRSSPLQPQWHRVLHIGDSSGNQSPLSFGGFGALLRHLERLVDGVNHALKWDCLDRTSLALLQPYQPNLSVTWLFQRSMSVGVHQKIAPDQINALLGTVFRVMDNSGDGVLKPFMQDVIQFPALAQTMVKTGVQAPLIIPKILPQVGVLALVDWLKHYVNLAMYTALCPLAKTFEPVSKRLSGRQQYVYRRWLQAWQYGSGQDYEHI